MRKILAGCFIVFIYSCSPKLRSSVSNPQKPLHDSDFVLVLKLNDDFVNDGVHVGTIKSGDNGLSTKCTYYEVLESLKAMARKNGANLIKIVKRDLPGRKSSCDRIVADIYRVPDYRKHEIEIEWNAKRKLTWDDFKGVPGGLYAEFSAGTDASMEIESNYVDLFTKPKLFTKSVFNCYSSFVRKTALSHPELLSHEQAHFDLVEIYRRLLQQSLDNQKYTAFNLKDAKEELESFYKQYQKRSSQYDSETNHGTIAGKQKEWEQLIAQELLRLREFEKTIY